MTEEKRKTEHLADGVTLIRGFKRECSMWLVQGSESALLIDTGLGYGGLRELVEEQVCTPYRVVDTHGHGDHSGGSYEFEEVYLHPLAEGWARDSYKMTRNIADAKLAETIREKIEQNHTRFIHIREGDTFDLGDRTLTVWETPGHTLGDICLLDSKTGLLFCGDLILHRAGPLLTDPEGVTLEQFYASLCKLQGIPGITGFCSGHDHHIIPRSFLDECLACAKGLLDGSVTPERVSAGLPSAQITCLKASLGSCSIRYFDAPLPKPKEE